MHSVYYSRKELLQGKAEEIARTVGVSCTTVHRVIATYNRRGEAGIDTPGKGGRRHQYLTLEQERAFLQPYLARAARGEITTAVEIQRECAPRLDMKSTQALCIAYWSGMAGDDGMLLPVRLRRRRTHVHNRRQLPHPSRGSSSLPRDQGAARTRLSAILAI